MPRGCRFRDLGEAHRNITGRSISNSLSNSASPSCSLSSNSWKPLSSHDGSLSCSDDIALQDMTLPSQEPCSQKTADAVTAQETSREQPDTPDSLVKSVYPLYQTHLDMSVEEKEVPKTPKTPGTPGTPGTPENYTYEKNQRKSAADMTEIESLRDGGATARLGFHPDEADDGSILDELQDVANRPGPAYQPRNLESSTCESVLFPKPLRVQSLQGENKHASTAVSMGGMTEDSDDDPFRYDRNPYKVFLHPSKEREVSAALKHISKVSSHSRATIYTHDEATSSAPAVGQTFQTFLTPPPIPLHYRQGTVQSSTPAEDGAFYDTSVLQPGREVKVVLQDKIAPAQTGHGQPSVGILVSADNKDDRDEWETVGTSVGKPATAPMQHSRLCHEFKYTGSSIADVSDESSCHQVPFDEYASTDRIVEPPSGGRPDDEEAETSEESLRIRRINGAVVPVMTPKHRVHRVNGMEPQSATPSRPLGLATGGGLETAAALARKMSNPFRQRSARRAQRHFSPTPLRAVPAQPDWGRSRFAFRGSMASGQEGLITKMETETKAPGAGAGAGAGAGTGTGAGAGTTDSDPNQRGSGSSQNSTSTTHSFSFSLIPLPEAARQQAIQRGSTDIPGQPRVTAPPAAHVRPRSRKPLPLPLRAIETPAAKNWTRHLRHDGDDTQSTVASASMAASYLGATPAALDASWNTTTTSDSTWSATTRALRSAATRLRLDTISARLEWQRLGRDSQELRQPRVRRVRGVRELQVSRPMPMPLEPRSRWAEHRWSNTPHLYPWDYQQRLQQQQLQQLQWQKKQARQVEADPQLRAVAVAAAPDYLEQAGIPQDPEAFLSENARQRRRLWFACMLLVSVLLPFLSVMVYVGRLDCGLSWYTRGEVARLSERQRRVILVMMVLQLALWPTVLVFVIWRVLQ